MPISRISLHQRCECVFIAAPDAADIFCALDASTRVGRSSSLSMSSIVAPSEYTIRKALSEFQLDVNADQIAQIQEYIRLLLVWNEKISLTAIRDPLKILYRHFCESMFATRVVDL